jgi:hypothetical protein
MWTGVSTSAVYRAKSPNRKRPPLASEKRANSYAIISLIKAVARRLQPRVATVALRASFSVSELFEGVCEIGIPEDFTRPRYAAVRHVDSRGSGIFQDLLCSSDVMGHGFADRETLLGKFDGRLQDLFEAHRAPPVEQNVPGIDDAADSAREQAIAFRNFSAVVLVVPVDCRQLRRFGFSVDRVDLFSRAT